MAGLLHHKEKCWMAAELRDLHCQLLHNFRGSKAVLFYLLLTDTQKLLIVENIY